MLTYGRKTLIGTSQEQRKTDNKGGTDMTGILQSIRRPHAAGPAMLLLLLLFCSAPSPASGDYAALLSLYDEFRAFVVPSVIPPDYGKAAMAIRQRQLARLQDRLAAIDDRDWPIPWRVNYRLGLAEMRGLEFQHAVGRPWERDPAFYSTINLGFGPKMHGAMAIPALPLDTQEAAELESKLVAVPAILAQARHNLTDPRGDLARLAIVQKGIERNVYKRLAGQLADHPSTAAAAMQAAAATDEFIDWLARIEASLPAYGGVGRQNYNWLLKHVLLFPYDWEAMRVLGEREYQRSMVFLKMEEHRHAEQPMIEPATTMEEYERRRFVADTELLEFLERRDIMTVPDWLVPPVDEGPYILPADRDPAKAGPFEAPIDRHFFREAEDRDPRPLRAHNLPGHLLDKLSIQRDDRPIRGDRRLYFISGTRAEGWAFYLEELIQQMGFLDDRPKTREINYILQAKRAARVLPELMLHANDWNYDHALASLTSRTPYWMDPDDPIARFDIELYLRQPGYGIGYYMGKVQLESLFAEVALDKGRNFDMKQFHDEFLAAGVIPISLIRWEITGRGDQVAEMRDAPPLHAAPHNIID